MLRKAFALVPLALAGVLATSGGEAVAGEKVRIALGGFGNMHYLPYDVAQALGYFTEQGLDVEFEYVKSGTQAASALIAGGVDFSGNSLGHALKAHLQGKSLKMIAAFNDVPGSQLLMRREYRDTIRTLADLKGRPLGVTGLGSGSHMVLSYVLTRAGLEPGEINAIAVGIDTSAAALENGRVDGIMITAVPAARLIAEGRAFVLLDLMARGPSEKLFGGPYIETGVLTRSDVIEKRPEACRKVVRAVVKANRWIAAHAPREIVDRLPESVVRDRGIYERAVAMFHDGFSRDGRIDPLAVQTVIDAHGAFGGLPAGQHVDPSSLFDNRFVDEALAGDS